MRQTASPFNIPPRVEAHPEATETICTETVEQKGTSGSAASLGKGFAVLTPSPPTFQSGTLGSEAVSKGNKFEEIFQITFSLPLTHIYWSWWGV